MNRLKYLDVYCVLFLVGTETFLVSPLLPGIADGLGVSVQRTAMIVTAYVAVYAVSAPFLGLVSDRVGRRGSILLGAVLFLAGNVLAMAAPELWTLILARAVGGLGAAMAGPSIWAHIAETSDPSVRGRAVGTGMAAFSLGQVVGIPIGGLAAAVAGWRAAFAVVAAGTAVCALTLQRRLPRPEAVVPPARSGVLSARSGVLSAVLGVWRHPIAAHALLVTFLLQGASLGSYAYLGTVLHERFHLQAGALGLIGVLIGGGSTLGAAVGGRLRDRVHGQGRLTADTGRLPLWCLLLPVGVLTAVHGPVLLVCLVGVAVWFFASGAFVTDQQVLLTEAVPNQRATASSWNTSVMHAATALGVSAVGLAPTIDTGVSLLALTGATAATLAAALLFLRTRRAATHTDAHNAHGECWGQSLSTPEKHPEGTR